MRPNSSAEAGSAVKSGDGGYAFSTCTDFSDRTQTGNTLRVTFNGLSTGDGTFTVHSTNNAGLDSTDGIYSVTPDPTAPSGGGLTVNGAVATTAGSSSYFTSGTSFTVGTIPYTDIGSGMASEVLALESSTPADAACGGGRRRRGRSARGRSSGCPREE